MAFDRDQIEAKLALNLIASAEMPQIALGALEAGLDGKAIRRLAVLEHPTYFEVAEVLPRVMQELGLTQQLSESMQRFALSVEHSRRRPAFSSHLITTVKLNRTQKVPLVPLLMFLAPCHPMTWIARGLHCSVLCRYIL